MSNKFLDQIKNKLLRKKSELDQKIENFSQSDPFVQESKTAEGRDIDAPEDEAVELQEHRDVQAVKTDLEDQKDEVQETIKDIERGTYGVCNRCGKKIEEERLRVYPTAQTC